MDIAAIRRLALSFSEAEDQSGADRLAFSVRGKGFAWSFMERVLPKKPRRPRIDILAVRCPLEIMEMLIDTAAERFFDDDHYRGYPAILFRLEAVDEDELLGRLRDGWQMVAPPALIRQAHSLERVSAGLEKA